MMYTGVVKLQSREGWVERPLCRKTAVNIVLCSTAVLRYNRSRQESGMELRERPMSKIR